MKNFKKEDFFEEAFKEKQKSVQSNMHEQNKFELFKESKESRAFKKIQIFKESAKKSFNLNESKSIKGLNNKGFNIFKSAKFKLFKFNDDKLNDNSKKTLKILLIILFFIASLSITFFSEKVPVIPTWNEVYSFFGLRGETGEADSTLKLDFEPMPLTFTALDVGQGECVFIYDESGASILVDTGESGNADKILDYMGLFGVEELDYLIITHPHTDHMGSAAELIERTAENRTLNSDLNESTDLYKDMTESLINNSNAIYSNKDDSNKNKSNNSLNKDLDLNKSINKKGLTEINNIIIPRLTSVNEPKTNYYKEFKYSAESSGARVVYAEAGTALEVGDMRLTFLGPLSQSENLNNMSLVIRLDYGETSFLLMGDAESEEEIQLLSTYPASAFTADVLLVGHHGSDSSSTYEFVAAVSPRLAVISCGKDNAYGHPHSATLNTLDLLSAEIQRTDEKGNIAIGSDGEKIKLLR